MTKDKSEKLEKLYELYEQPMYRIAYAILRNASCAEDAVSDAFMNIIRKIDKIGEPDSVHTKNYIIKTIKNASIDCYRKNRKLYERTQSIDDSILTVPDNSADVEKIVSDDNTELLKELNVLDRQIMLLRCSDELSWHDIADRLGLTEANARKRFERARKKIVSMKGELSDEK
ncbi:MAG: sigma-70 family RNA polymerase sigma factor [Ruminococcus sp.]|nr:sigma-70 family RNA polymerase sigma factor [Ruminococcus sp.]